MDDLISRQAAIDALKDMYHAAEKWGEETSDDVIKARAESCMASLIEMKLRIENLPSAQPEKRTEERTETHACDCISRQAAIDKVDRIVKVNHLNPDMVWFTPNGVKTLMEDLPSAEPNLQPTCNQLATDTISRQSAIDALRYTQHRFTVADEAGGIGTVKWSEDVIYFAAAEKVLADLPSAQPEDRCGECDACEEANYWHEKANSYEQTLVKLAQNKQPEIIRCKDCKHWKPDHTCREHSLVSPMLANEFCSRSERREENHG